VQKKLCIIKVGVLKKEGKKNEKTCSKRERGGLKASDVDVVQARKYGAGITVQ